jgi:hypothetical protein
MPRFAWDVRMPVLSDSDHTTTWPAAAARLLERHPRSSWAAVATPTTHFWIEVHDDFRRECVALTLAGDECRERRITPRSYAALVAPRLRGLLGHLQGHHEVEEHHYFPTLRDSAPALGPAFDRLAADHVALDGDATRALAALAELVAAAESPQASQASRVAAERFAAECDVLCRHLVRHLSDEEDLVIPLLLERRD